MRLALGLLALLLALASAGHALLSKRDPRAALGWMAFSFLAPFVGPLTYWVFGLNRIRTRARRLVGERRPNGQRPCAQEAPPGAEVLGFLAQLERLSAAVSGRPLLPGNRLTALFDGEEAYPAMVQAIAGARQRILLATYIFETNTTGHLFAGALAAARARGVEVRVLLDGVGELYSRPRPSRLLGRLGVPFARFLPPRLLPPSLHVNLRNHRKILVVDGAVGFTGGMNLGDRHLVRDAATLDRVADVHFRLEGPVVEQIEHVFLDDWRFATAEQLAPSASPCPAGDVFCRVIVDGPNEDIGKLLLVLLGALSAARERVLIVTPYFLPPREMIGALKAAAVRGVKVVVLLPEKSNLPPVHWATRKMLWELLEQGVEVYYQPGPFVHTKLFLVDATYAQIGSANLDPRSLRLNFELNVEVFDAAFAAELVERVGVVLARSRRVTLEEVDGRSLAVRLRDGLAWLASPYL